MLGLAEQTQFKNVQSKAVIIAIVCTISYGILIEILQEVMHLGRTFDKMDIAADTLGVLFGFGLFKNVKISSEV